MLFLLNQRRIWRHPVVMGEIAVGSIDSRDKVLRSMIAIFEAKIARHSYVLAMINEKRLYGRGVGYNDCQLIASAIITDDTTLWTRDKRMSAVIRELGIAYTPQG